MKLTKNLIDKIAYSAESGRRQVLWDTEIRNFGVRVYPSNRKSFVISYRYRGRKRLQTLGVFGIITLEQARKLARIKLGELANGQDPNHKKARDTGYTIRVVCEAYIQRHSKIHKKTWREDERRIRSHLLPAFGHLPIESLTVTEVTELHSVIGSKSIYEANRTMEILRGAIEKAKLWGMFPPENQNPAKYVERFKEKKRDRWLTAEELPRVAIAIDQEPSQHVRAAIWLYLLTGLRKSELLRAKWSDFSISRREIRIEDTKNGSTHYAPLSKHAFDLISSLPILEGNPYIIPGARKGAHLVNITKPWMRIRRRAGVQDVRLHDLRRTLGSMLAQSGVSLHLIGRILNHKSLSTTKIYARFGQDNVRSAIEQHGLILLEASKPHGGPGQDAEHGGDLKIFKQDA